MYPLFGPVSTGMWSFAKIGRLVLDFSLFQNLVWDPAPPALKMA